MTGAEPQLEDSKPRPRSAGHARQSTDPLQTWIDFLPLPALVADLDEEIVVGVNDLLIEALGGDPVRCSALFHTPSDLDNCRKALVRDGRVGDYEVQLRRCDGRPFWAVMWAVRVVRDDSPALVLVFYDCTAAQRAESLNRRLMMLTRHAREMRTLGSVTAGIAHDLSNILRPLINYSDQALQHVPPGSRAYTGLEQVVEAAQHAKVLARQILSFSRQDGGRGQTLQLQSIVDELLVELRDSLPEGIGLKTAIDQDCPDVLGEPGELRHVVANLCSNAVFAMRDGGGELGIELSTVEIDVLQSRTLGNLRPGAYARLTVRDGGHGMSSELLGRAFDSSTDGTENSVAASGLSGAHGIVARHGGDVVVRGEPGHGTTIEAYLPLADSTATAGDALQSAARGDEHVLIVEDREELAGVHARMLGRLGYDVTTLTSAVEAVELVRDDPDVFDVIVTEQSMPQMSGVELAGKLRALCPELPVILISEFKDAAIERSCRQIGVRELVMKPIVAADVGRAIRRALDVSPIRS